jgi:hypothetical protein
LVRSGGEGAMRRYRVHVLVLLALAFCSSSFIACAVRHFFSIPNFVSFDDSFL